MKVEEKPFKLGPVVVPRGWEKPAEKDKGASEGSKPKSTESEMRGYKVTADGRKVIGARVCKWRAFARLKRALYSSLFFGIRTP